MKNILVLTLISPLVIWGLYSCLKLLFTQDPCSTCSCANPQKKCGKNINMKEK
ncbi:MAG: hypothetical protein ACRCVW_03070 [Brevinema sp.]